ncbi:MAG: branched-chain amino acid ABC transporter permease [Candidatus Bathyarchaeia archaeon]
MSSKISPGLSLLIIGVGIFIASLIGYFTAGPVILLIVLLGFCTGLFYGMLAIGLSLVFGVMKVINIAHGEFILLGAYITYWLYTLYGITPFVTLVFSALTLFVLGLIIGRFVISPSLKGGVDPPLIISFGLSLCLANLMRVYWTATPKGVNISFGSLPLPGGVSLSAMHFVVAAAAIIGLASLHLFLSKTYLGRALRAVSMDREAAMLMSIPSSRIETLAYAIGLLLAGISGSLLSITLSFDPTCGHIYLGKVMCVIVLGGVGYIPGAVAGGVVLGIAEAFGSFFIGDTVRNLVAFVMFLLILIFKPTGLFAKYRAF